MALSKANIKQDFTHK